MTAELPSIPPTRKTGTEPFVSNGSPLQTTLNDFWSWQGSDLLDNTLRGIMAEYIVAMDLGLTEGTWSGWDAVDLQTADGISIEVKSSAYLQAWHQHGYSRIEFSIAPKKYLDPVTRVESGAKRWADVYVFCVLANRDPGTVDPLDLDQWEFYVLPTAVLEQHAGSQKTIGLNSVCSLGAQRAQFSDVENTIRSMLARPDPLDGRKYPKFFPKNPDLPFFAYGVFKPDQLSFPKIKPFVLNDSPAKVSGVFLERDGVPLIELVSNGEARGNLLHFRPEDAMRAYAAISESEPESQYDWAQTAVFVHESCTEANLLVANRPGRGAIPLEHVYEWDGKDDPFFSTALDVVEGMIEENGPQKGNLVALFQLEAAYMLLWTAIERFTALRYSLSGKPMERVRQLAYEASFAAALAETPPEVVRRLYRADHPGRSPEKFDPEDPRRSVQYLYQMRSNITHRGKALMRDHDRLAEAAKILLRAFRATVNHALQM